MLGGLWLNNTLGDPVSYKAPYEVSFHPADLRLATVVWSQAVSQLRDSPLLGVGVGGFPYVRDPSNNTQPSQLTTFNHAHNLFLQIAMDVGLIGVAAFIVVVGYAIYVRGGRSSRQSASQDSTWALALGVLAGFVVILTHGLFDTIYWSFKAEIFLWGLIGLAMALGAWNARVKAE